MLTFYDRRRYTLPMASRIVSGDTDIRSMVTVTDQNTYIYIRILYKITMALLRSKQKLNSSARAY